MTAATPASPQSNGYPYERLTGEDDIRVLDLLPRSHGRGLRGRLRTVSRLTAKYEALSYVWGPTTEGWTICLDGGHQVSITDNLCLAMRRLRYSLKARTLWIDALCINQGDIQEKSDQVAAMADTYRAAAVVDVWLGQSSRARSIHLRRLVYSPYLHRWSRAELRLLDLVFTSTFLRRKDTTSATSPDYDLWETRAWTIQEIAVACKVKLYLGRAEHALPDIPLPRAGGESDTSVMYLSRVLGRSPNGIVALKKRLAYAQDVRGVYPLLELLEGLEEPTATDPRDMVYSIVGLLKAHEREPLRPDYTLTYAQVCATATAVVLEWSFFHTLAKVRFGGLAAQDMASWSLEFARLQGSAIIR